MPAADLQDGVAVSDGRHGLPAQRGHAAPDHLDVPALGRHEHKGAQQHGGEKPGIVFFPYLKGLLC